MNYADFKEQLKSELSAVLTERGYNVDITDATSHKANKDLDGITIRLNGANVSPTIYTESTYEYMKDTDMSIRKTAERLADTTEAAYDNFKKIGFDPARFNADFVRDHAYIAVINTEMNKNGLLENVPHEEIPGTDLSAFAKVHVGDNASITITKDHAFQMGLTSAELLDMARENTLKQGFSVKSMEETLTEMMPDGIAADGLFPFPQEEHPSMIVITNDAKVDGASAIISREALDTALEKMGCDTAVILPSSRHELLAVNPQNMGMESSADLKSMVEEVNSSQVSVEDKLSDNIYQYSSQTHELTLCNEEGLFPAIDSDYDRGISNDTGMSM